MNEPNLHQKTGRMALAVMLTLAIEIEYDGDKNW